MLDNHTMDLGHKAFILLAELLEEGRREYSLFSSPRVRYNPRVTTTTNSFYIYLVVNDPSSTIIAARLSFSFYCRSTSVSRKQNPCPSLEDLTNRTISSQVSVHCIFCELIDIPTSFTTCQNIAINQLVSWISTSITLQIV
jgi:hypothetical protein